MVGRIREMNKMTRTTFSGLSFCRFRPKFWDRHRIEGSFSPWNFCCLRYVCCYVLPYRMEVFPVGKSGKQLKGPRMSLCLPTPGNPSSATTSTVTMQDVLNHRVTGQTILLRMGFGRNTAVGAIQASALMKRLILKAQKRLVWARWPSIGQISRIQKVQVIMMNFRSTSGLSMGPVPSWHRLTTSTRPSHL